MAEAKRANKDITIKNRLGQTVVIVPAGQPIPDNLDELKEKAGAVDRPDAPAETEDKAKRGSRGKSRR